MKNTSTQKGRGNPKSKNLRSFVALGLSAILPSLAFSTESDEALKQLLTTAPQAPSDSKNQSIKNYSSVVDLRSNTKNTQVITPIFTGTFNSNTTLELNGGRVSSVTVGKDIFSITTENQAEVTINNTSNGFSNIYSGTDGIIAQGAPYKMVFTGNGHVYLNVNQTDSSNLSTLGAFFATWEGTDYQYILNIASKFTFKASGNLGAFLSINQSGYGNGTYIFNSPYIEIDMDNNDANKNTRKYIIIHRSETKPNIYLNTNTSTLQADRNSNVLKLIGSINSGNYGNLYAYFTNYQSSLTGNLELGGGTSKVVFSDEARMTGDIDITGNGNHSITFDNANFIGSVKNSDTNNPNRGVNTTVIFKNTAGQTFGNGTSDIVTSSYKGSIIGIFDVSARSTTTINGGSDGSKGFQGSGTNTLTFDFKGNANSNVAQNQQFTIGGGNTQSLYVMSGMTEKGKELDLSGLNGTDTLYSKIKGAGISIKAGGEISDGVNSDNVLQGTLFFQKTNMQVGTNGEALFATEANIVGTNNKLNDLTLGAMFGNATWNDKNKDGAITGDEIVAHAGKTNYKLSAKNPSTPSPSVNDNTSTGDIGNTSDNIKKQVAFIFADDTYLFGGVDDVNDTRYNKQGYSGSIEGGTNDSKYYFANAGYVNRTQIEDAKGDLILFNTAFRGDLGVANKDVSILLDFSGERNGLRAENGVDSFANIVGSGSKNITFNFTGNTKTTKYGGAVVGATSSSAKYTMLNLQGNGDNKELQVVKTTRNAGDKTLVDAIQGAGVTGFNKTDANGVNNKYEASGIDQTTNIGEFATDKTILALRGTSLDATNINFQDYIYDFAFGEGLGKVEGVTIEDSILTGDINLSSNANVGHKIILRGNALGSERTEITFKSDSNNFVNGGVFVYDDSTPTQNKTTKTLKVSGLNNTNKLTTGSELNITQTNFEGDIYADGNVSVNLDFSNGRTWKMNSSSIFASAGKNIVIDGNIVRLDSAQTTPTLVITQNSGTKLNKLELINTGASLTLTQSGSWSKETQFANSFSMRGTSITNTEFKGRLTDENATMSFVFAKEKDGDSDKKGLLTTKNGNIYITDKASGEGNYIAQSSSLIQKFVIKAGLDLTFIGAGSHNFNNSANIANSDGNLEKSVKLTFVNAGSDENNSNGNRVVAAGAIGHFFRNNSAWGTNKISIEGSNVTEGNWLVQNIPTERQGNQNFTMTFIQEGTDGNTDTTYVGDKYSDLKSTTNANGALAEDILQIQESKLIGGIDFANTNANILFVGNGSQNFDGTGSDKTLNALQNGSSRSIFTFRDSDLNAGSTTSSIRDIKGTIAFDLTHTGEDMSISGTLRNMLASGGKHQVQFTGRGDSAESVTLDRLVFVNVGDIASSTTLGKLDDSATAGQYFNDADTFGSLSQADYSDLALLAGVNDDASSSLTLANDATVALTSGEVVFVGANSHKFGADSGNNPNKLGNSTGGTLTFVDAGTLKVDNLINLDNSNAQQGKGTINLIGSTKIEKQSVTRGSEQKDTLSLYKSTDATGNDITINAIFSASNALADNNNQTISESSVRSRAGSPTLTGASTYDIGQTGEQTIYHLLFDYTSSQLTFGQHHAYTGNIYGLTSDSIIKFKNAGYIDQSQIANTQATILVDNTQIKGDFRGDFAILDFRNDQSAITGKILTSDVRSTAGGSPSANVLSQKVLTFDLTGSTNKPVFSGAIQAGYKIAPNYTSDGQSVLTFQNTSDMTLGDDSNVAGARGARTPNGSVFIQSLAKDVGFSGIADAEIVDTGFTSSNTTSYILKGTKLAFQGTSIDASALTDKTITENTYFLDLSFGGSGTTALGEDLNSSSVLTANSIVMGELTKSSNNSKYPLGLSLSFANKDSLVGATKGAFSNVLDVKVKENAIFNLNAQGSEKIGTIVLSQNSDNSFATLANVATESSMNISAGSMGFVGQFIQATPQNGATAGAINVTFNGTNKAYGVIAGQGDMKVALSGNALFTDDEATALGYTKDKSKQFADLVIDLSSATSSTLNLAHTSGIVGLAGVTAAGQYTSANLNSVAGNIALKGNFDLGQANLSFVDASKSLKLVGDTAIKVSANSALNFQGDGLIADAPATLTINSGTGSEKVRRDFTFVNIDSDITVELKSLNTDGTPNVKDWGVGGLWNFRGTNLKITSAFWSESNAGNNLQTYVFAKGSGTGTEAGKLSSLTTDDKISESTLAGDLITRTTDNNVRNLILKNAKMTFIGKESFGIDADKQKIDGTNGKITFGFYNGIVKSGYLIFDNTNNGNHKDLGKTAVIQDAINLAGTDTFNLSVGKMQNTTGANNSTINAVYVNGTAQANGDISITGVRYIDASGNHAYASAYATSNAGGALSQTQLKTLESKAYGNITLDNTVTATMKFIGENSHSFDGKTIVEGSGTSAKVYQYVGSGSIADITTPTPSTAADWNEVIVSDGADSKTKGAIYLKDSSNPSNQAQTKFAQIIGGNENSRFDFDHTTVALDLVKFAGGKTYIYNSNISGNIAVTKDGGVGSSGQTALPSNSSTTIVFNEQMTTPITLPSASANFIQEQFTNNGTILDLGTAHKLKAENLGATDTGNSNKVLANTEKQTNLVFIGKGSIDNQVNSSGKNNNSGSSIDLSFMPTGTLAAGYSFTFVNAGEFTDQQINNTGKNFGSVTSSSSDGSTTIFGSNAVILVDTYVMGERAFSQKGFIDMAETRNQKSSWTGNDTVPANPIIQELIFDFNQGVDANNQKIQFNGNQGNAIANTSAKSLYVFTNIFTSGTENKDRVLTLSANGLRTAINNQLKSLLSYNSDAISDGVKGTLGLRGVSIQGDINEDTTSGNKVDIVFNSTSNISYIDGFDESGKHTFEIKDIGANKVANITGINTDISGYAVLMSNNTNSDGVVTIKGSANKDITFIGDKSVKGGFDKLKIEGGSKDSNYTFYEVGTLSQTFLENVGLHKNDSAQPQQTSKTATLGNFTFANSTIKGNINVDQSIENGSAGSSSTTTDNILTFDNVDYSGTISGTLKKKLKFGANSNNIIIIGGGNASSYDFSNLAGSSINLSIDMKNSTVSASPQYFAPTITGFENGDISLVGSLKLAMTSKETNAGTSYSNSFAFNNNAKWTVTGDSRVMNLSLRNTGTSFNLDLASAPRTSTTQSNGSNDLRVLEVGNLSSDGGQVLLGTMIDEGTPSNSKSDKIKASVISGNGTLYITAKDTSITSGNVKDQNIVLVTADSSYGKVVGAERKEGLSYVTTNLVHQTSGDSGTSWNDVQDESTVNSSDSHRWILSGFDTETNQELVDESGFIVSNPYRMLMIETNNLNKRMGDLRDNDYNQGAWIRVFNGSDSGDGAKNLYTNIQLGYDYGTPAIGAKNYSGVAFSTSIVDIDGNQYSGKANTYSLAAYNAYIADSGLYVDTIAKYLYTDQKITPSGSSDSSFGSHALSLGVEVGYRAYMGESNFYFETQAEAIGGVIFGVKDIAMGVIGGRDINGELKTTTTFNTRVGLVQGYSLKTQSGFRADFRLGASLVNEFVSEANPVVLYDGITEASTSIGNDTKVVLNVGTNLILTDQWRVYIDAERSFGGSRNTDYQANIGARFSFGEKITSLPKPEKPLPLKVKEESKK